jgi:hypothetical protein
MSENEQPQAPAPAKPPEAALGPPPNPRRLTLKHPEVKAIAVRLAALGIHKRTIADWLGVSERSLYYHARQDADFCRQLSLGRERARALCLAKLLENVAHNDERAIEYMLERILGVTEPIAINARLEHTTTPAGKAPTALTEEELQRELRNAIGRLLGRDGRHPDKPPQEPEGAPAGPAAGG